jgi:hypothetical protein
MSDHPLTALANQLLMQFQAFGLLGYYNNPNEDDVDWVIKNKYPATQLLFQFLELSGRENALPPHLPFLYNTQKWPRDLAPAGYIHERNNGMAEYYVLSQILFWNLQRENREIEPLNYATGKPGSSTFKLIRACLWLVEKHGFTFALQYLLDLADAGYVTQRREFQATFDILCKARRLVSADHELVYFLVSRKSVERKGWIYAEFNEFDLATHIIREDLYDDIRLLTSAFEAAENNPRPLHPVGRLGA